jgi:hypothetical protein
MHNAPFGGQPVFIPDLLDMYQRALPLAEHQVL